MASLRQDPKTKRWQVNFVSPDGKRRTVRLGEVPKRVAETHQRLVESLLSFRAANMQPDPKTAADVAALSAVLTDRYRRAYLIDAPDPKEEQAKEAELERRRTPIGPLFREYIESLPVKDGTRETLWKVHDNLTLHFGTDRAVSSIDEGDALAFREWLAKHGNRRDKNRSEMAEATVRRRIGVCKQLFRMAVKRKLIESNPFEELPSSVRSNADRQAYVSLEIFDRVLEMAPDQTWRALLVLARIAGLRTPSEPARLTWADINWEGKTMKVHASKTEHHAGRGVRIVPLFPRVEKELLALFTEPEDGQKVFPGITAETNLRTTAIKMIRKAGIEPWPKLWQNLRASAATDLARELPGHVAAKICGHTEAVAQEAYWQTTEHDLQSALGVFQNPPTNPLQQTLAKEAEIVVDASGPSVMTQGNKGKTSVCEAKRWAIRNTNQGQMPASESPEGQTAYVGVRRWNVELYRADGEPVKVIAMNLSQSEAIFAAASHKTMEGHVCLVIPTVTVESQKQAVTVKGITVSQIKEHSHVE